MSILENRKPFTRTDLDGLTWAVENAADWRGSIMGSCTSMPESLLAEQERLKEFDQHVKRATRALAKVRRRVLDKE